MKRSRQPYWKPQHEVFIRGMLLHGDKLKAYKEAYPDISPAAVRQAAYRLLSYPHIRQRIDAVVAEAKEAAVTELKEKTIQQVTRQLVTAYERRVFLADIIHGHIKLHRSVRLRDRVVEVEEDLDPNIVLRAIELDCKLEAGYEWPLREDAISRQMDRLVSYLSSSNAQGVAVCKRIETDCRPNPLPAGISHFGHAPFVTQKGFQNGELP